MSSHNTEPCPICFETVSESRLTQKARYSNPHSHSWDNSNMCNAHGICWSCLAKHIEIQVLSEGKWNIRCPGESCKYHLLPSDIHDALQDSDVRDQLLDHLTHLSNQSCQARLKDIVYGVAGDKSGDWLLEECQPCPNCFVIARRETGCDHVACRCGSHFCFRCGAPHDDGCICDWLESKSRGGEVFFAAWLRSAYTSPCEWLWEEPQENQARFVATLGFWCWLAGAHVSPPESWDGYTEAKETKGILPPLRWRQSWAPDDDGYDYSDYEDDDYLVPMEQDLAGHLRKEAYSLASHRVVRRATQRKLNSCLKNDDQIDLEVFEPKRQVVPLMRKCVKRIKGLQWQEKYKSQLDHHIS